MAVFRENNGGQDRSAEDRRRHKELVEDSIRRNIINVIAEESIIGQSKDKKIKIPVKGIKEYRFIYGRNSPSAGTGDGSEKRGDNLGDEMPEQKGKAQAGNQEGEEIYETEISMDELINYLFEDLDLPDIDRRKLSEIESVKSKRYLGYQLKGTAPRLAKRRSAVERIKRKQAYIRNRSELIRSGEDDVKTGAGTLSVFAETDTGRFPFMEEDLRYRRVKEERKKDFNAVVICIMDVSGSMDQTKKYMARSFYFLLYRFLCLKYINLEIAFIAHTTIAKEVNEDEFFHRGESGGTYISSGYEKALEVIEQRYNPKNWNIYAFHCSDGDNWAEDNKKAVDCAEKLCEVCNLFGYGEIAPGYYFTGSTIKSEFHKKIKKKNFVVVTMTKKEDILKALKKLLEKDGE